MSSKEYKAFSKKEFSKSPEQVAEMDALAGRQAAHFARHLEADTHPGLGWRGEP